MRPSVLGGFLGVAGLKALVFAGTILLSQIIIRFFGAETLGQFSSAMAAILLMGIIFRGGLPVLLLRKQVEFPDFKAADLFGIMAHQLNVQRGRRLIILPAFALLVLYLWTFTTLPTLYYFLLMLPLVFLTGWLQLKANYFKITDRPKTAAVCDMGLVNVALVLVILLWFLLNNATSLLNMLIGFCVLTLIVGGLLISKTTKPVAVEDDNVFFAGQGKLLLNALLMFVYRNGYPLIFAIFASAEHIGKFRVEERLAFAITFIFLVFETLFMKRLVTAVSSDDPGKLMGAYRRFAIRILAPTIGVSAVLAYLISWPAISNALQVASEGQLQSLIFLAAPFYVAVLFNTLILNLKGKYGSITFNMAAISMIYVASAAIFYSNFELDGLRAAYTLTGICGALISTAVTIRALKEVKNNA